MSGLFADTHIHLEQYAPEEAERMLREFRSAGGAYVVAVSMNLESARRTERLARQNPGLVRPAYGFHPEQPLPSVEEEEALFAWMERRTARGEAAAAEGAQRAESGLAEPAGMHQLPAEGLVADLSEVRGAQRGSNRAACAADLSSRGSDPAAHGAADTLMPSASAAPTQAAEALGCGLNEGRSTLSGLTSGTESAPAPGAPQPMIAVGEVGLPYYSRQEAAERGEVLDEAGYIRLLERFVAFAARHDLPIVLHAVYEDADTACDLLERHGVRRAHFHWFKGSAETVERMIALGYYISFTPDIRYEDEIRELALRYPTDQVMSETDGPWPFEGPFAGQPTHPSMTADVCREWAALRDLSEAEAQAILLANANRFYG